jgi:hypothetical protein
MQLAAGVDHIAWVDTMAAKRAVLYLGAQDRQWAKPTVVSIGRGGQLRQHRLERTDQYLRGTSVDTN